VAEVVGEVELMAERVRRTDRAFDAFAHRVAMSGEYDRDKACIR